MCPRHHSTIAQQSFKIHLIVQSYLSARSPDAAEDPGDGADKGAGDKAGAKFFGKVVPRATMIAPLPTRPRRPCSIRDLREIKFAFDRPIDAGLQEYTPKLDETNSNMVMLAHVAMGWNKT